LNAVTGILNSISDMPAKSFNIRRKSRSTPSESPFTIRRKPVHLASEYAPAYAFNESASGATTCVDTSPP
jgi:hypothetical protein